MTPEAPLSERTTSTLRNYENVTQFLTVTEQAGHNCPRSRDFQMGLGGAADLFGNSCFLERLQTSSRISNSRSQFVSRSGSLWPLTGNKRYERMLAALSASAFSRFVQVVKNQQRSKHSCQRVSESGKAQFAQNAVRGCVVSRYKA